MLYRDCPIVSFMPCRRLMAATALRAMAGAAVMGVLGGCMATTAVPAELAELSPAQQQVWANHMVLKEKNAMKAVALQPVNAAQAMPMDDAPVSSGKIVMTLTEVAPTPEEQKALLEESMRAEFKQMAEQFVLAQKPELLKQAQETAQQVADNKADQLRLYAERVAADKAEVLKSQLQAQQAQTQAKIDVLANAADVRLASLSEQQKMADELRKNQKEELKDFAYRVANESIDAKAQAIQAQLAALSSTTEVRLSAMADKQDVLRQAANESIDAKAQAIQAQLAALSSTTEVRLNALADKQEALRQVAEASTKELKDETYRSLVKVAEAARLDVLDLEAATSQQLESLQAEADRKAMLITNHAMARLEEKLAKAEAEQLKPEQAQSIAQQVVAEAAPQFKALAMQTLADSRNYIRTVAADAIKDGDPAIQQALANTAKRVITQDDKVVFAIRQALTREDSAGDNSDAPATVLGPDHETVMANDDVDTLNADDVLLDAARLGVGTLAPPVGDDVTGKPLALRSENGGVSIGKPRHQADWVDLRSYRVVVHEDRQTLKKLISKVLKDAEPFVGPWQVKWKLSADNMDLLQERFSLDAETTFEDFINYLAQYIVNDRGVKLTVNLFDAEHVMVISD